MSRFYHFFGLPVVLFISIPFAVFAAFTTSLAFGVLFVRLLIVYIDLGIALAHSAISSSRPSKDEAMNLQPTRSPIYEAAKGRRRRSVAGYSTPPRSSVPKTSSFASLVGTGTDRDYEGVGGWRLSADDEEEALWMNLNSRLELPATSSPARRNHKRSLTGASQRSSPEMGRSPSLFRTRTPGTASPEGYFSVQPISSNREGYPLGISRVSFDDNRPRSTAVSSTDSLGLKLGSKGIVKQPGPT